VTDTASAITDCDAATLAGWIGSATDARAAENRAEENRTDAEGAERDVPPHAVHPLRASCCR